MRSAAIVPEPVLLMAHACTAWVAVHCMPCHVLDPQTLFSNILLRCPLSICRLCHAQSYGPS